MSKYILKKVLIRAALLLAAGFVLYWLLFLDPRNPNETVLAKPVILLYPQETIDVSVKLEVDGLTSTYPKYDDGWKVTAHPDGRLEVGGKNYNYLFWEAENDFQPDFSTGFCVKGEDTAAFLEEKLELLGLNEDEANDFIVYWLPRMEGNPYNIISFQTDNYHRAAPLEITPKPDSLLRVFMAFKGSDRFCGIPEQELVPFERVGFAAVEWGGCEARR